MALGAHSQQVDIEIRYQLAGCGVGGQHLLVRQRRGGQVAAEFTVAGRHRVHVAGRDVDVVEQRLTRLFVVALVVVLGNVTLVAPEEVHLGPVDLVSRRGEVPQQPDTVAAAGQHDQCPAPGHHGILDGFDQSLAGGVNQGVAVREGVDDRDHMYCTLSIPSSAAK